MMKSGKKLARCAAAMFTSAAVLLVGASANYTASERGLVSVNDTVSDIDSYSGEYDRYVTFKIYDQSGKLLWFGQDRIDDSGSFGADLKIRGKSGTYTLIAKNRIFGERSYDIDYTFRIYIEFNDVKNSGSAQSVIDFLVSDGASFGFPVLAFNGLSDSAKDEIVNKCLNVADINSMDELTAFVDSLKTEQTYLDSCTDADELLNYISSTYENEELFFATPETKFFSKNMSADEQKALIADIASRSSADKFATFKLDVIKSYASTRDYFKDVELLIYNDDNICEIADSTKSAYELSNKNEVLKKLKTDIANVTDVAAIDQLLLSTAKANPLSSSGSSGSSSGSSSGGSSGGSSGKITKVEVSHEDEGYFDIKPPAPVDPSTIVSTERFADLTGFDWAKDAVYTLCDNSIVNGVSDSQFAPSNSVTREQFASMITKALRLTGAEATVDFADVPEDSWYYRSVAAAVRAGIIKGLSKSNFGVGSNISRQDAAVMLARVLDYTEGTLEAADAVEFSDSADIAQYAADSVATLANAGIIGGRDGNIFAPKDSMSRAEAAVMLCRFFTAIGLI